MIGPSSTVHGGATTSKRKMIFDDVIVDIDLGLCDEFLMTSNARKRYVQDLMTTDRQMIARSQQPQSQPQPQPQRQEQQQQQQQSSTNFPTVVVVVDDRPSDPNFPAATPHHSPAGRSNATGGEEIGPTSRLDVMVVNDDNDVSGTGCCAWTTVSDPDERHRRRPRTLPMSGSSMVPLNDEHGMETAIDDNNDDHDGEGGSGLGRTNAGGGCEEFFVQGNRVGGMGFCDVGGTDREQQELDQDNGNLSWLLDFKLDSLIEAADDRCAAKGKELFYGNNNRGSKLNKNFPYADNGKRQWFGHMQPENMTNLSEDVSASGGAGGRQQTFPADRHFNEKIRCDGPKKPPFTYTELIEHALQERGELTVSAIYQWISEHFPYYKSNDDRWKNSVRHNLSINPHFRKGSKAPHGAGHLWAIANPSETRLRSITGSGIVTSAYRPGNKSNEGNYRFNGNGSCHMVSMDEVEAATASITQQPSDDEPENIVHSVTLEHCAEQILSGIKRQVEVQYLVPMMIADNGEQDATSHQEQTDINSPVKESDFLNPVSKEVVAEECGLLSEGYLVTDLNPATLGLNMVEHEMITPDNLFGEDLSFQFYELTSPSTTTTSQIQSA